MVGLFVFRNEPKHDSADAMHELRRGGIDCVMVTGDSALTGAAVARTVGIVPKGHKVLLGSVSAGEGGRKGGEIEWREIAVEEDGDAGEAPKVSDGVDGAEAAGKSGVSNEELELTSDGDCVLAVTGDAFSSLLDSDRIEELVTCRRGSGCADGGLGCKCARIKIFGRMGPHHKVQVRNSGLWSMVYGLWSRFRGSKSLAVMGPHHEVQVKNPSVVLGGGQTSQKP